VPLVPEVPEVPLVPLQTPKYVTVTSELNVYDIAQR
jgi:hypothetical protein